jgi:hypothetical protein
MKLLYLSAIALSVFSSCGFRIGYLGNSSAPTEKVDVFVDPSSIKKPYSVMGKGFVEAAPFSRNSIEKIQNKAIKKARQKGADAILFEDYYLIQNGTTINNTTRIDTVHNVSTSQTTVSPVVSSGRNILFLKYSNQ